MAETIPSDIPDEPPAIDEDEATSGIPTLLLAFVTLALYILFLKPTAAETENNNNNNNARPTRELQRQRGGSRRQVPPQQQQQQQAATPQQQQQARRRLQMSENALEVLETCKSLPPHVVTKSSSRSSSSNKTIGGFEMLSESGLVAFSHTRAAAESSQTSSTAGNSSRPLTTPQKSGSNAPGAVTMDRAALTPEGSSSKLSTATSGTPSLLQRKERAKILSRLFAATNVDHATKGVPAPPSKGSTFVIGVSQEKHLSDGSQRASLLRVIKGLAAHYTVLLVVSPPQATDSDSSSYETTQALHASALKLLRGDDNSELSETLLPSHRVLLAGSATGRVALVRQLSTNIGLTVDFETSVKEELERFGYEVSIVTDWGSILPPAQ